MLLFIHFTDCLMHSADFSLHSAVFLCVLDLINLLVYNFHGVFDNFFSSNLLKLSPSVLPISEFLKSIVKTFRELWYLAFHVSYISVSVGMDGLLVSLGKSY